MTLIWHQCKTNFLRIWLPPNFFMMDSTSGLVIYETVDIMSWQKLLEAVKQGYVYHYCRAVSDVFVNSLAPGKFKWNFRYVIFKWILVVNGWHISCEIALIWMSLDFTDNQSTLVQVMTWCLQATSHYLSQCWPRSLTPYGITRPQWVNSSKLCDTYMHQ